MKTILGIILTVIFFFKYCHPGCTLRNNCFNGYVCHQSRCQLACENDKQCAKDYYCHIDHKVCHRNCTHDQNCAVGYQCVSGRCLLPCTPTAKCNSGQYCHKSGVCWRDCLKNSDCGNGQMCNNGQCTAQNWIQTVSSLNDNIEFDCVSHKDCQSSLKCFKNNCVPPCIKEGMRGKCPNSQHKCEIRSDVLLQHIEQGSEEKFMSQTKIHFRHAILLASPMMIVQKTPYAMLEMESALLDVKRTLNVSQMAPFATKRSKFADLNALLKLIVDKPIFAWKMANVGESVKSLQTAEMDFFATSTEFSLISFSILCHITTSSFKVL